MMFVSFNSNMTGVTSGTGTANPSRACVLTPGFKWGRFAQSLVCAIVLFLLAIVLSVL